MTKPKLTQPLLRPRPQEERSPCRPHLQQGPSLERPDEAAPSPDQRRWFSRQPRRRQKGSLPPCQPTPLASNPQANPCAQPQHNAPSFKKPPRHSTGALPHGDNWTIDLNGARGPSLKPGSLAARISNPNAGPAGNPRQKRRAAQVAQALIRTELDHPPQQHARAPQQQHARAPPQHPRAQQQHTPAAPTQGLMIRGLAGPIVVVAENFAEGTTAADIDSALSSTGGAVERVILTKTKPFVIAEILFTSKEGADQVVEKFHGLTVRPPRPSPPLSPYLLTLPPRPTGGSSPCTARPSTNSRPTTSSPRRSDTPRRRRLRRGTCVTSLC